MSRRAPRVLATLAAVCLACGCGVSSQDAPQPITDTTGPDTGPTPSVDTSPSTTTTPTPTTTPPTTTAPTR